MKTIGELLKLPAKPKEIQQMLVGAIVSGNISIRDFIGYFESAGDVDKGTCADVMKHVSAADPGMLAPYISTLVRYINYKAPRVRWGVSETIGNMAGVFPGEAATAVPFLLGNTTENSVNTTVIRWCAAYALAKIAENDIASRTQLIPVFEKIINEETNNGVRNVYLKTLKKIRK